MKDVKLFQRILIEEDELVIVEVICRLLKTFKILTKVLVYYTKLKTSYFLIIYIFKFIIIKVILLILYLKYFRKNMEMNIFFILFNFLFIILLHYIKYNLYKYYAHQIYIFINM